MDPNVNLLEQLALAQAILKADAGEDTPPNGADAVRLAELVQALSTWISNGGFLPDRWELAQRRSER